MDATNIKLIGCDIVSDAYPTCTHSYTSYQIHVLNVTLLYGSVIISTDSAPGSSTILSRFTWRTRAAIRIDDLSTTRTSL